MDEKHRSPEGTEPTAPDGVEQTQPEHDTEVAEKAQAESESAYNDPIGGMPIA